MAGKEENRIYVGGLAWNTRERHLEDAFRRYGKITECVVMLDKNSGRPRGFGFITFADRQSMEDAMRDMHGRELDGRVILVNKATPKMSGEDLIDEYERDHISNGRSHMKLDRLGGRADCFNCGRLGHVARECPSGESRYGQLSSHYRRGGDDDHGHRFDRYDDYNSGCYGDREQFELRASRYESRISSAEMYGRYPSGDNWHVGDRNVEREPHNGYRKDLEYNKVHGPRSSGYNRFSGGPEHFERRSYRDRRVPYDRSRREGRPERY